MKEEVKTPNADEPKNVNNPMEKENNNDAPATKEEVIEKEVSKGEVYTLEELEELNKNYFKREFDKHRSATRKEAFQSIEKKIAEKAGIELDEGDTIETIWGKIDDKRIKETQNLISNEDYTKHIEEVKKNSSENLTKIETEYQSKLSELESKYNALIQERETNRIETSLNNVLNESIDTIEYGNVSKDRINRLAKADFMNDYTVEKKENGEVYVYDKEGKPQLGRKGESLSLADVFKKNLYKYVDKKGVKGGNGEVTTEQKAPTANDDYQTKYKEGMKKFGNIVKATLYAQGKEVK